MLIDLTAGSCPDFMKIVPLIDAIKETQKEGADLTFRLIHTGQHYVRH